MSLRNRNIAFTASGLAFSGLIITQVITSAMTTQRKVRLCYFTSWAQYRFGSGRFVPSDIEPSLCTHLLYAFANVDLGSNSLKTVESSDLNFYTQILALRNDNPDLKVLLSVGGAASGTEEFEALSKNTARIQEFVSNAISFLRRFGFDGLDVDWEFPRRETRALYQEFIKLLGVGFILEASRTGKEKLILTIDVAGDPAFVTTAYGPEEFMSYVDYINLMAYDLWGAWSTTLGHHSPLHVVIPFHYEEGRFSMHKLAQEWIRHGVPKDKLVMGLATYGSTGVLNSASQHDPGDLWARHKGTAGPLTRYIGVLSYYEICDKLKTGEWQSAYNTAGDAPYAWNEAELQYVSYDNERSFAAKAQYILDEGLAGALFWTMDFDDFRGLYCNAGSYPLLGKVKGIFERNFTGGKDAEAFTTTTTAVTITTAATTKTTTTAATTTAAATTTSPQVTTTTTTTTKKSTTKTTMTATVGSGSACPVFQCRSLFGLYPDPADCSRFYQCVFANPVNRNCPPTLLYDTSTQSCNWPDLARCHVEC